MNGMNERAWRMVEKVCRDAEDLKVRVLRIANGTRIVDMGIEADGGLEAGLAMAEIGMAGLGSAIVDFETLNGTPWPWVTARTDHPLEGCFLSQAAHWPVQVGPYRAMGSGPACLLNPDLDPRKKYGIQEIALRAVLVLETGRLPDEEISDSLAAGCCLDPENLTILIAPTSSLAGSVQIAARSVETALHKLAVLGFDLRRVTSALGKCPVAVPCRDELTAIGRTNDAVIFGSRVWLTVRETSDEELSVLVKKVPANSSPNYGEPFMKILLNAGGFYAIDPGLFTPAEIVLTNLETGQVHCAGESRLSRIIEPLGE